MKVLQEMNESVEYIKAKLMAQSLAEVQQGGLPQLALILGSGLGTLADEIQDAIEIDYADIPNFPVSTVEGHAGKLIIGKLRGKYVVAMKGRFHYYEGYAMDEVVFPVRVMKLLGIQNLLVTNAAGGINKDYEPGDLMLIKDHIKFFSDGPLRGKNMDVFGPRFNDMSNAYTEELRELAKEIAYGVGMNIREGVYAFMPGPSYETPAEIKMLGIVGADAVGMSTVPEVITAAHAGMRVLGISCITNMAAGILDQPLNHEEVMDTAEKVKEKFVTLVSTIIEKWR